ncbi:radical SAM protein, partial [Nocardia sp. NPDC060220]|uniref:radical SAM protein n=1 Tax=Nocardia sp. NPDC060220 TaxID=3347076 RepID=UPI003659B091
LGTLKVDIAGGEPLSNPALPQIFDTLDRHSIYATLTTSAAASPRMKRWLIDNCTRFVRIVISIDGPESLHNSLRGRRDSFLYASELADKVRTAGGSVRINTVITRQLALEPQGISDLSGVVANIRPAEWMLIQPHPANEKESFTDYAITFELFERSIRRAREQIEAQGSDVKILVRDIKRYSAYWLIYPDGILSRHTEGPTDLSGVDFVSERFEIVQDYLESNRSQI